MQLSLNNLKPASGSKKAPKRLGRGIGSGWGKTAGRGHKGQHARKGGYHKIGFEGGQTPLQRSLRKFGFRSHKQDEVQEVNLRTLEKVSAKKAGAVIDLQLLKDCKVIRHKIKRVKVIATGKLTRPISLKQLSVTSGARQAIEASGGSIQE